MHYSYIKNLQDKLLKKAINSQKWKPDLQTAFLSSDNNMW